MIYSKHCGIAALVICLGASSLTAMADDDSSYDAQATPKRSTLTIHGLQESDNAYNSGNQQPQSTSQYSPRSKYAAAAANQYDDGSGKNRTASWNTAADADSGSDDQSGSPRSGSRAGSYRPSTSNSRFSSNKPDSYSDQEPKLFTPSAIRPQSRSANSTADDANSNWNNSQPTTSGRHYNKNATASYSTPTSEVPANSSTYKSGEYSTSRSSAASQVPSQLSSQRFSPKPRSMTLAQNSPPSDFDQPMGSNGPMGSNSSTGNSGSMGNGSSVMSSKPESVQSGTPMKMGGGDWSDYGDGGDISSGDSCGCDTCGGCNGCCFNPCGCCGWYGDVDYLLVRPTFSEQEAYLKRTTFVDPNSENTTTTDQVVHQDYGYSSSIRMHLGYRFGCGDEIRFGYWNFGAQSHQTTGAVPDPTDTTTILFAGQGELNASEPGEHLENGSGLQMNVYDIDYIKCTSCCGGCNECNPCGRCCPPWSWRYSVGVRIADVRRGDNTEMFDATGAPAEAFFVRADYIGAGPRVGLEGRRFFGGGCASLFARTNFSLLLGDYNIKETRKTPPSDPTLTEVYSDDHDRMIPVAEIELGGSWQWSQCVSFSAGYLFQAWWDLGQFEQIEGNVFLNPIDDSNIMAFDGLFARVEVSF